MQKKELKINPTICLFYFTLIFDNITPCMGLELIILFLFDSHQLILISNSTYENISRLFNIKK